MSNKMRFRALAPALFLILMMMVVPILAQEVATEVSPDQVETWQAGSATASSGLTDEANGTPTAEDTPTREPSPTTEPTLEATETPPGDDRVIDAPTAEEAAGELGKAAVNIIAILEGLLLGLAGTAVGSPLTEVIVALWKRIPGFEGWSARVMNITVGITLTLIAMAAGVLGVGAEADRVFAALADMIPTLMMLFGVPVVSSVIYKAQRAEKIPILGFSRTPPPSVPRR